MKITVGVGAIRPDTLDVAVRSICRQTWPDWELIVVGQGDDPGLQAAGERIEGYDRRIRYVHIEQHGACRARNKVFRRASGSVIALIDDDCEAEPGWLATFAACMTANPSIGAVGGALVCPPGPRLGLSTCPSLWPAEVLYDPVLHGGVAPAGWDWVGCSVAIRTDVVQQIGHFDESLGPGTAFPAAEDTDYKFRLERAGIPMLSTPRAVVRHTHGRRAGLRAVTRSSRNYARGNGGLAGKLTLLDDPRGRVWVSAMRRLFWHDVLHLRRLPAALYRLQHFLIAYREVLTGYTIDAATGCLAPKTDTPSWSRGAPTIAG